MSLEGQGKESGRVDPCMDSPALLDVSKGFSRVSCAFDHMETRSAPPWFSQERELESSGESCSEGGQLSRAIALTGCGLA